MEKNHTYGTLSLPFDPRGGVAGLASRKATSLFTRKVLGCCPNMKWRNKREHSTKQSEKTKATWQYHERVKLFSLGSSNSPTQFNIGTPLVDPTPSSATTNPTPAFHFSLKLLIVMRGSIAVDTKKNDQLLVMIDK